MTLSHYADNTSPKLRRVAAHIVAVGETKLKLGVVTLCSGMVTGYYPLDGEQPYTEWLGGTIEVKPDSDGCLRAYRNGRLLE